MREKWKMSPIWLGLFLVFTGPTVKATDPKVDSLTPSCGSVNGGTRITIYGSDFARSFFTLAADNDDVGSKVELANHKSFECKIHVDGSTEKQITCDTEPMPAGEFTVKVSVDGVPVRSDRYCNNPSKCIFKTSSSCGPTITELVPFSGMPGSFLVIYGDIKTTLYGSNLGNEFDDTILRVYFGNQKCELRNTDEDVLYGIYLENRSGWMKCQTEGTYIGNVEVSFLISNGHGRSQPDKSILHLRRKKPSMYQTFTEISSISQSQGSTEGGTRLTITGQHFDETDHPAKVYVGGQECEIVEPITDTTIVCVTPADASVGVDDFTGGRGLYSYRQYDSVDQGTFTYDGANVSHTDSSSWQESSESSFVQRLDGFFVPPRTGNYTFYLLKDGGTADLLFSESSDSDDKTEISSGGSPLELIADTPYYMEIQHASSNEDKYVTLKARLAETDLTEEDTGMADHEVQDIHFTSTITQDIQMITVAASGSASTSEANEQTITISGNPFAYFAIGLDGIFTVPFQLREVMNGEDVEGELQSLPNIYFDVSVQTVVTGSGIQLTITSESSQGEIHEYMAKVVGGAESEMTFSVVTNLYGKPNLQTFTLTMDGIPTPPIDIDASASEVQSAIESIFTVLCHPKLFDGNVIGFESSQSWMNGRVSDVEPFCGRYSVRNPTFIYHRGYGENDVGLGVSSTRNTFMCFAYKGYGEVNYVRIRFTYIDEENEDRTADAYFNVDNDNLEEWTYHCKDIYDVMQSRVTGRSYFLVYVRAYRLNGGENLFIDHVTFNRRLLLDDPVKDGIYNMRRPQVQPNDYFIDTVTVTSSEASQYQIQLSPHHCGYDLPPFEVASASMDGTVFTISNGGEVAVNISRLQTASPPISGFFSVIFKGAESPSPIPVTVEIDTDNIRDNLATMSVIGYSEVNGWGTCSDFTYRVKMISTTGDQPMMEVNSSLLEGTNVGVTVRTHQDGGVWLDPIMGDLLRTHHTTPQVIAFINDIPTRCSSPTACTFEWTSDFTPTVSDISPSSGSHGDIVSIHGTGFDGTDPNNNEVFIGVMPCTVISADSTTINCTINNGPTGVADVKVYVDGKGFASTNVNFTYVSDVDPFTSISGSVEGGTLLTITGFGFTSDAVVTLDDNECMIETVTESQIICLTPQAESELEEANVTIVITQPGSTIIVGEFTYDPDLDYTPVIEEISQTTSNVWGGDPLTINGAGFGEVDLVVTLGGVQLNVTFYNDSQIIAILPALPHGPYKLLVHVENKGYADLRTYSIPNITYTFQVTSMTPAFGSLYGGTDILISGDGFSTDKSAFDVTVGDHACDVESVSSTSIKCRIAYTGKNHYISEKGLHKFYGIGYAWTHPQLTVKVGDCVTWHWETPEFVADISYGVHQTESASDINNMEGGFTSGENNRKGSFTHCFTRRGTYYYWTGFLDSDTVLYFRGTMTVKPLASYFGSLSVQMHDYEASYDTAGPSVLDTHSCFPAFFPLTNCTDTSTPMTDSTKFNFEFRKCYSPYIKSMSQTNGTTDDTITVTGDALGIVDCQNQIEFNGATCETVSSAPNAVGFKISSEDSPAINVPGKISVRVVNLGYALNTIAPESAANFVLFPWIESVTPSEGSKMGGTKVTISGSGFNGEIEDIFVHWQYLSCDVESVNYTHIICTTHCEAMPDNCYLGTMEGFIEIGPALAECPGSVCNFTTLEEKTATITDVSPDTVSTGPTDITIIGEGFGTDPDELVVIIGGEECDIFEAVTDTNFTCTVGSLPVGNNKIDVFVSNNGRAATSLTIFSENVANISSPSESSIYGGAIMTVSGNGFVNGDTSVTVGGEDCPIIDTTFEELTCTLPAHMVGDEDVVVMSNGIQYQSLSMPYSMDATPNVVDITPSEGESGDEVTITGSGFKPSDIDPMVTIGEVECNVIDANDTSIVCTTGTKQTGHHVVQVFAPESGYSNNDIMFTYKLGDFSVSPSTGSTSGGQAITLDGSGFLENETAVTICGEKCTQISASASEYVCSTPKFYNLSATEDCDVVVTVRDVTKTNVAAYTYNATLVSSITSVNPRRAGTGGGTLITITGTNFGSNDDEIKVTLVNVNCIVQTVTDTEITCFSGGARSGDGFASVQRNGWGEALQIDAAFTYIDVWSNPATWGGHSPPSDGEFVVIPPGQKILLDTNNTGVLVMLLIQGEVIFDEENIELQAENILITDGGSLNIGSAENPFPRGKKAIITLHGHLRSRELPIYGTKTIAVREGTLNLYGSHVNYTWTRLSSTAAAGSSEIELMHSVDWQIGDEIVIATTGPRHSQKESEVHVIRNISSDGYILTLESPLAYEHLGISGTFGDTTVDFRAEVGLLTRNIVVRGYRNTEFDTTIEACPEGFNTGEFATQTCFQGRFGEELGSDQFGAQVMVHQAEKDTQIAQAHLQYVEFTHSGQAFRLGRYPVHFHLNGNMSLSFVRGCAIHTSFNRAINVHGSHYTLVEHNVVYNVMGGALFLEDGDEIGNIFQYNLGIFIRSSTSLRNDDITPAFIWVTNPYNFIRHNAAAGGTHFGTWYRMHEHPDGPGRDTRICPQGTGLGEYRNNSAHSLGWFGLWIFQKYVPREISCNSNSPHKVAKFHSLTAWNCEKGAEGVNTGAVQFREFVLVNNEKAGYEGKLLVSNPPQFDPENGPGVYDSVIVAHYDDNLRGPVSRAGVVLPYYSGFMVDSVEFYNFDQENTAAFRWARIDGTCGIYCGGFRTDTVNLTFVNSSHRVAFDWESEGVLYDLDGSLTDDAGYSVAACTPSFDDVECFEDIRMSVNEVGCICTDQIKLVRFSFNNIVPHSLNYKNAIFTSIFGSSYSPWGEKRISHPRGWSMVLMANNFYNFTFEDAEHLTNISFNSVFYNFDSSDVVVLTQFAELKPDLFALDGSTPLEMSDSQLDNITEVQYEDWYYSVPDRSITYAISHSGRTKRDTVSQSRDFSINLKATKCYYVNCEKPKPPSEVTEEPEYKQKWSDPSTWVNYTQDGLEPKAMDDLTIDVDKWIILDKEIPPLGKLVIEGGLQFESDSDQDIVLDVDYIYITGRLIVGWSPEDPYHGNVIIRLRGSHATPPYPVTDGPSLGSKFIAVFGGLQLHGVDRGITKTFLDSTVESGDDSITVRDNVTWKVDDEILISTTDYSPWHTEVFKIVSIMDKTITLNDSIKYRHIAHSEDVNGQIIDLSASVALLTRNIRIEGKEYPEMEEESFGARVVVGQTYDPNHGQHSGFAQVYNTEFYNTGQEGFSENYDARYSLTYSDVTSSPDQVRYSYVKKSTFHSGYNTAIGVFGTDNLEIDDNVVYHTVGPAIQTESTGTMITNNLVTLSIWPGAYQDRFEKLNIDYDGAIHAIEASELFLINNTIAGSERVGYRVPGQSCGTAAGDLWTNNMALGCLAGVLVFDFDPVADSSCVLYHGFILWKNVDFGIYYQNGPSVEIKNNILVENGVSVFPFVTGPHSLDHSYADKTVTIEHNIVIGKTSSFNESLDKVDKSDHNIKLSSQGRSVGAFVTCGKIGVMMGTFSSGTNNAPEMALVNIHSYQSIKGLTRLTDNTFVNFGPCTDGHDHAITTNKNNDDGIHPLQISDTTLVNVDHSAKVHFHPPNVGKVNPSDCVDMDCDGLKKCMIRDLDGTFMGSKGTVLPNSAYEWDGDPRHGLGDYRIPLVLLTSSDGQKRDVDSFAPHKGIFKADNCTWIDGWNAFQCGDNYEWRMLVIESMDKDTETRRLSPVAIYHPLGYIDLINGPQDHGWCAGYTCQKRLSTFQALVALDEPFDIFLTSTNPKVMRYMLLNSDPDECVRLGMWYHATYRLDLDVDGVLKYPTNAFRAPSGAYRLRMQETTYQYMPDVNEKINGQNFVSQLESMIFWVQCGGSVITVTMRESFIVAITLPAMTETEFFGEKIVGNLVAFFALDPSKVRIVNVISDSSNRRKRQTDTVTYHVEFADEPGEPNTIDYETLIPDVVDAIQLGTIDEVINATVLYIGIIEPDLNGTSDGEIVTVQRVGQLVLDTHPVANGAENEAFQVQPKLKVTDSNGDVVTNLGSASATWEVEASIKSGDSPTAMLVGDTISNFDGGWANFTNLAISEKGSYILEFQIISPPQATNYSLETFEVTVTGRNIGPRADLITTERLVGSSVELEVGLVDIDASTDITDIEWANHTWTAAASIYNPDICPGTLGGTLTVMLNSSSGTGMFDNLLFSAPGVCPVLVVITSDRDDYEVRMVLYIDVMTSEQSSFVTAEKHDLDVKLPIKFDLDTAPIWAAKVRTHYSTYPDMRIVGYSYRSGSLIITLNIEATISGYNDTLNNLCSDIESGISFTVDNQTVSLSGFLTVDGITYYGVSCGVPPVVPDGEESSDDNDGLDIIYIIIIAVLASIVLILLCILIAYKCHTSSKSQSADTQSDQTRGLYTKSDLLPDALSRDGTLTSLKSRPYTPSMPPMSTNRSFDLHMPSPSPSIRSRGKVSPEPFNGSPASSTQSRVNNALWSV